MKRLLYVPMAIVLTLAVLFNPSTNAHAVVNGLVESPTAKNVALFVGVTYGLPGIDIDMKNLQEIATHPGFAYSTTHLWEDEGTRQNVAAKLTDLSGSVTDNGSFFFYFSGHGSNGGLLMQDGMMQIGEIRAALEKGRENKGPIERLVLMFDSCYSGSLVDPVRRAMMGLIAPMANQKFADELVSELTKANRDGQYWKKLFVFASSRADETSMAGTNGSAFTVSLRKAFDEAVVAKSTVGEFIQQTQKYTEAKHHPVARLVPTTLAVEQLVP